MVAVIIGSKRMGINPDNVATPMAASFGDLITLALLAFCGQWFYSFTGKQGWTNTHTTHTHWARGCAVFTSGQQMAPVSLTQRSDCYWVFRKQMVTFSLHRTVYLCTVPGGSLVIMPNPSLDSHRLQTPGQSHPPPYRLGTNHYGHGHQQVFTIEVNRYNSGQIQGWI